MVNMGKNPTFKLFDMMYSIDIVPSTR